MTVYTRIMARTEARGDCLVFTGYCLPSGYGQVTNPGGERRVHRVVWEHHHGPIDLHVLHRCDNPPCVKLDHLFTGTQADNMADRDEKERSARGLRNGRGKLSDAQVAAIRRRYAKGEPPRSIAPDFNIQPDYVGRIVKGADRG